MSNAILLPVDFSDVTEAVVAEAVRLGRALGAALHLLHVATPEPQFIGYEMGPILVRDGVAAHLRQQRGQLNEWAAKIRRDGQDVTATLVSGEPVARILEHARRMGPLCIVLGSHGHGAFHHLLAGSVCTGVLRKAACPVHIVPSRAQSDRLQIAGDQAPSHAN
jgi:nucleotide-binding universal stress UspA family protein